MKTVKVVCGIIWKEDQVFIARRKPEKSLGGYWEFPGGKVENDESAENALVRELREELGMEIRLKNYIGANIHQYETFSIELMAFECEYVSASFKLTDHDDFKFTIPIEIDIKQMAPADHYFVDVIQSRLG